MRERLRIFVLLAILWLSYMIGARVLFMVYNFDLTASLTSKEILLSNLHGLRMDASIAGYFLAFTGLILTVSVFFNPAWLTRIISWTTITLLIFCGVIITVDLELYRHWGFRLNTTPLLYISKEAVGSVEPLVVGKLILIFLIYSWLFLFIFKRKINPRILYLGETKTKSAPLILGLTVLMFLPIRGSFTVAPMNTGFVYYHNTKAYANHSAVNVVWNFLYNARKGTATKYPENFFDKKDTDRIFNSLYDVPDSSYRVINTPLPNIILIVLESFTADVIEPLGGKEGITPNLNELCKDGILFDNIYSSGDRTDKGLISILSGYPAQPQTSIIKLPAKTQRLPQLNQFIKKLGYHTSFLYGGDIDFANFRSYLNTGGFDHITTLDDFDDDLYTSKWGVHDHFMFEKAMQELDSTRAPFFKVILTLSSHEPFDVPIAPLLEGNDPETLFLNSCYYADQSLGTFITYCKSKPWWTNTVVVITADHGHRHPGNKALHEKERFRIPLLFTGGAITIDSVMHIIGSQTDIANTLLGQLNRPSPDFIFSKNLFNREVHSFAPYFFNDGYGFVIPGGYIVYDNAGKRFLKNEGTMQTHIDISKAYQQKLYTNYNNIDK